MKTIHVWDSHGKYWKLSKKRFKKLAEEADRLKLLTSSD
jgi:hypothetical protein